MYRIIFSLQLVLKFLTNYFIVSNQIVKHLRGSPGDIGFLRKTKLTTGLESRLGASFPFSRSSEHGRFTPENFGTEVPFR